MDILTLLLGIGLAVYGAQLLIDGQYATGPQIGFKWKF